MPDRAPQQSQSKLTNADMETVAGFGDEWSRFDQHALSEAARLQIFNDYFAVFPWGDIDENASGADIGCGSGRWAQVVSPRVGYLFLVDASADALQVARENLAASNNVSFLNASVGDLPLEDESLDFAYSLGVLHHVPDTAAAVKSIAGKLKKGAPFLVYLYYAFDNQSPAYRLVWKASDVLRRVISKLPNGPRFWVSQIIACVTYWPLARMAWLLERLNILPKAWPLSYYRDKPFYVMRTDALDRFGTRLEQRFTRAQITQMLTDAGFADVTFSESAPFWCATAKKA